MLAPRRAPGQVPAAAAGRRRRSCRAAAAARMSRGSRPATARATRRSRRARRTTGARPRGRPTPGRRRPSRAPGYSMPPYSAKRVCDDVELHRPARLRAEAPYQREYVSTARAAWRSSRAPTAGLAPRSRSTRTSTSPTWRVAAANGPMATAMSRAAGVSLTIASRRPAAAPAARSRCPSRRPRARPARRARAATPPPASRSCRRGRCTARGAAPPRPRVRARGSRCPAATPRRSGRSGRCGAGRARRAAGARSRTRRAQRRGEVDPVAPCSPPRCAGGAARRDVDACARPRAAARAVGPHPQPHALERRGARVDEGDVLGAGQCRGAGVDTRARGRSGRVRPVPLSGLCAVRDEQRADRRREQRQQAHGSALAALRGEGDEHAAVVVVGREHVASASVLSRPVAAWRSDRPSPSGARPTRARR